MLSGYKVQRGEKYEGLDTSAREKYNTASKIMERFSRNLNQLTIKRSINNYNITTNHKRIIQAIHFFIFTQLPDIIDVYNMLQQDYPKEYKERMTQMLEIVLYKRKPMEKEVWVDDEGSYISSNYIIDNLVLNPSVWESGIVELSSRLDKIKSHFNTKSFRQSLEENFPRMSLS